MAHGLLIIGHTVPAICSDLDDLLRFAQLSIARRFDWLSFDPAQLQGCSEDLVLADASSGPESALKFFHWLRQHALHVPTLAIVPSESRYSADLLREAAGAVDDFLLWPARPEEFRHRLARLLGDQNTPRPSLEKLLVSELSLRQLVGKDPVFLRALTQVALFGSSDAPVLITGETGTGKELCARIIHLSSKRSGGPFIPVDCGSVPDHLFENELFGHARGAFTDAQSDQRGLVAVAHGGTLFMDELDGLSPAAQAKVLRLLQESTYRPLGAEQFRSANLRVIAASNADLEAQVRNQRFRQDLFFRVNVLRVHLPPLRERATDIALLARHFLAEICQSAGISKKVFSPAALAKLESHDWPGNVRELYNAVQRAALCPGGPQVGASQIELSFRPAHSSDQIADFRHAKVKAIERFERDYVHLMLQKHDGNVTRAAREAGKDRRAFGRLVKKYNPLRNAS